MVNTYNLSLFKRISPRNLVFFLLWPFGTLIFNLYNRDIFEKKTIFLFYLTFLGFVFIYGDLSDVEYGGDSKRYAYQFINISEKNLSINEFGNYLYTTDTDLADIYSFLTMYVISRFTSDPRFYFMIISFIFSWFYINNAFIIYANIKTGAKKNKYILMLFFSAMLLIIPIWYINALRFWTASHVFIYGLLSDVILRNKRGKLWIFLSVFVHFAFIYMVLIYLVYKTYKRWSLSLIFGIYIITIFSNELKIDFSSFININFLPEIFYSRFRAYTDPKYYQLLNERVWAWHYVLANSIGRYITIILVTLIYLNFIRSPIEDKIKPTSEYRSLYIFLLLASIITNLVGGVAEIGRFVLTIRFMIFGLAVIYFNQLMRFRWVFNLLIPFLLFYLVFQLRVGTDHFGIWSFVGNPFIVLYLDTQTPIIDFVKEIVN